MSVKVENLKKVFGEQIAVNSISFEVEKGEIVGFLGPNGAGKSTTMKMITGYLPADDGDAWVCGKKVSDNLIETHKRVGYLPESNPLYYDMYVREYLQFLAGVHQLGTNTDKRIDEVIEMTGLQLEVKKKIGSLSKGYKQRVGIAQAIIHNPDVLILDEPTSGLDPNQIVDIRELIKQFGRKKTVILSTHIMQEVEAMCDRVIIINQGNIVANDKLHNLTSQYPNSNLEDIFRMLTKNLVVN
jgi:ABC-2 type transport system ATP-binding protein